MDKKRFFTKFAIAVLVTLMVGIAVLVLPAQASQPQSNTTRGETEPACNSCHDNLYYNYDLGKSYCVGPARTRCVACHDGDASALDITTAHAGMDAYPVKNGDSSRCQGCHGQNTPAYVEKFSQIAGFRSRHYVTNATYNLTPQVPSTNFPEVKNEGNPSWIAIFLLILIAGLHLVGFFLASRWVHH